ncbi:pilus assembly protein PapD [Caballeronia mineralivorans PML1(12)]|uniref:Pilus assembly protein PapD n=1 Tax=Caballeronia mineralivorans PML1(12) TaxID=908627 RepID=A0A0J1D3Q9_9BURK|nr:molecular chaperone [Caballeronia mineralivorans]KLU27306.1 pilus assembly protein PapD [Caballeronia mineralivorans PML1(12)]
MVRISNVFALLLFTAVLTAQAATLQISPVMVDLQSNESATGITLRNPGDRPLYGQVRVFRWDQSGREDTLTPTQELVASPPLIQIGAQADQLVRLVRTSPAPVTAEQSYRILIDELPSPDAAPTGGVMIRLRYSVPVFVEPAGKAPQPVLSWHLVRTDNGWVLRVDNGGQKRAQIAAVQLVDSAGKVYEINKGLLGYALAGSARQWPVPLPAEADMRGTVKVRAAVNSLPSEAAVTVGQPG